MHHKNQVFKLIFKILDVSSTPLYPQFTIFEHI